MRVRVRSGLIWALSIAVEIVRLETVVGKKKDKEKGKMSNCH